MIKLLPFVLLILFFAACSTDSSDDSTYFFQTDVFNSTAYSTCAEEGLGNEEICYGIVDKIKTENFYSVSGAEKKDLNNKMNLEYGIPEPTVSKIWNALDANKYGKVYYVYNYRYIYIKKQ